MKRQLVIIFIITFSLALVPRISTVFSVSVTDAQSSSKQFLEQVAGFHTNETIVFNYIYGPWKMLNTQDTPHFEIDVSFTISNNHGNSDALITFVDGNFWRYYLDSPDNLGTTESSLNESLSKLISALNAYQALLNASYCKDFGEMVSTALETQASSIETSDSLLRIEQTNYNSSWLPTLEVSWFRKIGGQFTTNFQSIQVGMRNGLITRMSDSMGTYYVATTSVAVSHDQAMNISKPFIEAFAQENQLNIVSISATLNYTVDGSSQRGDSFAIYPFWFVQGSYDRSGPESAGGYSVIIWADNGNILGEGPNARIGSGLSATGNLLILLIPASFATFVLPSLGAFIWRKTRAKSKGVQTFEKSGI